MATAQWSNATDGNNSQWSSNKDRSDLVSAATTYDDSSTDYDSITVYYDGYNPTTTTPEGENPATWSNATNASTASWAEVS